MALGGILGAALNTAAAHPWALWVDGVDVARDPSGRYSSPVESWRLTHAGIQGASSFAFTVDDPQSLVSIIDGATVIVAHIPNTTQDATIFRGTVDVFASSPIAGGAGGRVWTVTAVGEDAELDWITSQSDFTTLGGAWKTDILVAFLTTACSSTGDLMIADCAGGSGVPRPGAGIHFGVGGLVDAAASIVIPAGTTLREAWRQISALPTGNNPAIVARIWIDTYSTLRVTSLQPAEGPTTPYADLAVVPLGTDAGQPQDGANLNYRVEGANVRGVAVRGTGAFAMVSDGSGRRGPIAYLRDDALTTTQACRDAGAAYLLDYAPRARGSVQFETRTALYAFVTKWGYPGNTLTITEPSLGLAAAGFVIGEIVYQFHPGSRVTLTVAFGGPPPQLTAYVRRLTRATRS